MKIKFKKDWYKFWDDALDATIVVCSIFCSVMIFGGFVP